MNETLTILIITTMSVFAIEFFYLLHKKNFLKNYADYLFNWKFPKEKPFTLLLLPTTIIIASFFFLDKIEANIVIMVLAITSQTLLEEIIFRGMIFGGLLKKFYEQNKNKTTLVITLLAQALIFSLLHYQTKNFTGVFTLGIILGTTFYLTNKEITTPTLIHLTVNFAVAINSLQ